MIWDGELDAADGCPEGVGTACGGPAGDGGCSYRGENSRRECRGQFEVWKRKMLQGGMVKTSGKEM